MTVKDRPLSDESRRILAIGLQDTKLGHISSLPRQEPGSRLARFAFAGLVVAMIAPIALVGVVVVARYYFTAVRHLMLWLWSGS